MKRTRLYGQELKGVIFDKDGTLFNYRLVWRDVLSSTVSAVLTALGKEDTPQLHDSFLSLLGITPTGVNPHGLVFTHNHCKTFLKMFGFCVRHRINLFIVPMLYKKALRNTQKQISRTLESMDFAPQIALFTRLKDHGYRIGIITSDTAESCEVFLSHMGLASLVDFIATRDHEVKRKPHPEAFHEFCRMTGLSPGQVAVVGDTDTDMLFARRGKAGYIVAVLSGSNDVPKLTRLSDVVYPDILSINDDTRFFPR
ncbi:MAG: HAD family hydrolase [Sphaerochaetaceae bacterium]|nr:HAD family hydrolase [Sphaerochaetaceae bacterium]